MPEQNNGLEQSATDQLAQIHREKIPQQPKPQCIDLTPPESMNVGYVGGVHALKKKSATEI
jgi:hypothetical protein